MKRMLFLLLLLLYGCSNAGELPETGDSSNATVAEIASENIEYFDGITGYLASPEEEGDYPGIVMIHEWWGLNENIRRMADALASEGYTVLAVDLFGGKVAETPEEAQAMVSALSQEEAIRNMRSAVAYLREREGAASIGSLGWCFGGGQSLQLALASDDLNTTVIYYGNLVTNETELSGIGWPVLGIFGEDDEVVPVNRVYAFEEALNSTGTPNEIYIYPGVGHAFANPSGDNYAPEEAGDAWQKTLAFLRENLR